MNLNVTWTPNLRAMTKLQEPRGNTELAFIEDCRRYGWRYQGSLNKPRRGKRVKRMAKC